MHAAVQNDQAKAVINSENISGEEVNQAVRVGQGVTFTDLMPIPKREQCVTKRPRAKLPTYNLTSDVHLDFISVKNSKAKESGKSKAVKKGISEKKANVTSKVSHKPKKKRKRVGAKEEEGELIYSEKSRNHGLHRRHKWQKQLLVC